jgi:hypothetical protein
VHFFGRPFTYNTVVTSAVDRSLSSFDILQIDQVFQLNFNLYLYNIKARIASAHFFRPS